MSKGSLRAAKRLFFGNRSGILLKTQARTEGRKNKAVLEVGGKYKRDSWRVRTPIGAPDQDRPFSLPATRLLEVVTRSPEETLAFGRMLARELQPPCLVLLEGELGSGKTTLTKGIVSGLGAAREEEVTSPSFTLVHEYGSDPKVYHIDLYRVESARELATLGLDDLWAQQAIVIIEWGEKLWDNPPAPRVKIRLEYVTSEERRITIECLQT